MFGWSIRLSFHPLFYRLLYVYHFAPCFSFSLLKARFLSRAFPVSRPRESSIVLPFNVLFWPVLFSGQGCRFGCNVRGKNIYRNILARMFIECQPPSFHDAMILRCDLSWLETLHGSVMMCAACNNKFSLI